MPPTQNPQNTPIPQQPSADPNWPRQNQLPGQLGPKTLPQNPSVDGVQTYAPLPAPVQPMPPSTKPPLLGQQFAQPVQYSQQPYPAAPAQAYSPTINSNPPQPSLPSPGPTAAQNYATQPTTPYDFFLNPVDAKNNKSTLSSITQPKSGLGLGKVLLAAGFIVIVLAVVAGVFAATRKQDVTTPQLSAVAVDQQEIIHISGAASKILESSNLLNFATTALITTTSAQQEYVKYLNLRGLKISNKQLALTPFTQVDNVLSAAQTASTYDATFTTTMRTLLTDYQNKILLAVKTATTQNEVAILNKNLAAATLLQSQLGQ